MADAYVPTLPMIRELARAHQGVAEVEAMARATCVRRGLLTWRGALTPAGSSALTSAVRQFEQFGARRG